MTCRECVFAMLSIFSVGGLFWLTRTRQFQDGSLDIEHMEHNEDPFWDPNEFMSMGYSTVFLKPLAYCMPIEDDYAIYHDTQAVGVVHVKISPCRDDGTMINEEDDGPYDEVEEPKDLIGKRLDVLVQVSIIRVED